MCCAVLCCAVLCCAVLCCAVLCCAVLCCAVLCCNVLCCAVICCAVLCCAVLNAVHLIFILYASHFERVLPAYRIIQIIRYTVNSTIRICNMILNHIIYLYLSIFSSQNLRKKFQRNQYLWIWVAVTFLVMLCTTST